MVDSVRALLGNIEEAGAEGDVDVDAVVAIIQAALDGPDEATSDEAVAAVEAVEWPSPQRPPRPRPPRRDSAAAEPAEPPRPATCRTLAAPEAAARRAPAVPAPRSSAETAPQPPAHRSRPPRSPPRNDGEAPARRAVADSTIRVDVDLLDSLMRLVGELVLTRNQVVRHAAALHDVNLQRSTQRLNLIASELQEGVMKTRMQPIDHLWAKLPRVVRDLSHQVGKQIELVMVGRDTELDRTLLEAIKDPLTHIVRNSVDHGIENAETRAAAGKNADRHPDACAPSTRAARSSSRSATTAAASTRRGSAPRRSSAAWSPATSSSG